MQRKEKAKPGEALIAKNRRAGFDFELGDRFEAGIVLKGNEVKMLRAGKADLTGSFCSAWRGEMFLQGLTIAWTPDGGFAREPEGVRKLLLHKREIELITQAISQEGRTAIATRLYFKDGRAKVEVAIARGKRMHDKRDAMRERDATREVEAARLHGERWQGRDPRP